MRAVQARRLANSGRIRQMTRSISNGLPEIMEGKNKVRLSIVYQKVCRTF